MSIHCSFGAVFGIALYTVAGAVASQETAVQGRELHDQHCLACHDTSVYTRENRFIGSPAALKAQVTRCAAGPAKLTWGEPQIEAVTQYLNQAFYHF